jgi:hypothetical protein
MLAASACPLSVAEAAPVVAGESPPNPVNTAPSEAVDAAEPPDLVEVALEVAVDALTLVGSWAPHGLFSRHAD